MHSNFYITAQFKNRTGQLNQFNKEPNGDELHHNLKKKKNLNMGVCEFLGQEQKITQPHRKWIDGK